MSTTETDVIEIPVDAFWSQIEALRENRGWKQTDLAHHAGLSNESLRTIHQRTPRQIKMCEATRLFRALGYELSLTITKGQA